MVKANLGSHGVYLKPYTTDGVVAFYPEVDRTTILLGLYIHANTAPTTSENLTISRDSVHGPVYDTVMYTTDPSVSIGTNDLVHMFDEQFYFIDGDIIRVDYPNSDGRTYGITLVLQEAKLHKSI